MARSKIALDFLQTVTNVHFGVDNNNYVVVKLTATKVVQSNVPSPPSPSLSLGTNEKLIQTAQSAKNTVVPAHNITKKYFFVWNSGAPLPTADDFGEIVGANSLPYGPQFSLLLVINGAGGPPTGLPGVNTLTGVYNSLAEAQTAVNSFNTFFATQPPGSTLRYQGTTAPNVDIPLTNMFATELDVVTPIPATATSVLTATYLVKVPSGDTTMQLSLSNADSSAISGDLYTGQKVVTNSNQLTGGAASSASASATKSPTTYVIETDVPDTGPSTITITGGGGGTG